jgi:hypothetical protein
VLGTEKIALDGTFDGTLVEATIATHGDEAEMMT